MSAHDSISATFSRFSSAEVERRRPISALVARSAHHAKIVLEKLSLIFTAEGDLKPDTALGVRNRLERGWLDMAVIQPRADEAHPFAEGTFRLFFDTYDEGGIERHVALLPLPVRRERWLSLSWRRVSGRAHQ
jgi:hypothetical protein